MSWSNWSSQGFGFKLFNGQNDRHILEFIRSHIDDKAYAEISDKDAEDLINCEVEYFEIFNEYASEIVAGIINRLEGYTVFAGYPPCCDTDQEEMLGVWPDFPWRMEGRNKDLSVFQAASILRKYANMLGIKDEPDYFDAYYCG